MLKKAIPLGIISILALALIGGIVVILARPYETDARAANEYALSDGQERGGQGRALREDTSGPGGSQALGRGQGQGQGRANAATGSGGANGSGTGGPGTGAGNQALETYAEPVDWTTITGPVLVAGSELTVQTEDGEVLVGLGQSWYREDQGFQVSAGDEVRVEGYEEDGEFKAGSVENLSTGATITLRDATGRPMWAGRGQRQQQESDG
jgi:hypothetical protein